MVALWVIVGFGVAVVLTFTVLGHLSRTGQPIGLVDGKLAPCPNTPNCISSEDKADTEHYVPPISLSVSFPGDILEIINKVITDLGGSVGDVKGSYLSATFKSRLFGFIDDLEIRMDEGAGIIHVRSGSRVGYSDKGVNKKRIENLKDELTKL